MRENGRGHARGEEGILTRLIAGAAGVGVLAVIIVLVANAVGPAAQVLRTVSDATDPRYVPAGAPLGMIGTDPDDPEDAWAANAPPGGVVVQTPGPSAAPGSAGLLRVPVPKNIPIGPRRVGIQAGHWKTEEAPAELRQLVAQTGAAWEGVTEVEINVDIAQRIAVILNAKGIAVDILPTTVPPGYLADAVVALHADSDGVGERSGFKMAHNARRGPYEDALLNAIKRSYGDATGMYYDAEHTTRNMTGYYLYSWTRFQHTVNPYTPGVILEMGYVSNDEDRSLMLDQPQMLAQAIADGIFQFLSDTPRTKIFGQELVVPAFPSRGPSPAPRP